MNTLDRRKILLLIVGLGIGLFAWSYSNSTQSDSTIATPTPVVETGKLQANYEFTATQSGQTALELLEQSAEVETTSYGSAGDFVTKINRLEGSNEYYWAFYLNGEYAEKGASQTTLNEGDTIKFVYEAVSLTN